MLMNDWCPLPTHYSEAAPGDRRMSEPARGYQNQRISPPMPPRPRSAQPPQLHPNCEVDLDEVGEGELESKLVLPDEMMQYLQQSQGQPSGNPGYRNSPLPCRSPICTNPTHCAQRSQQQQQQCNSYNVQQQCYQESNPQTPGCPSYASVGSPYSQCSNSRQTSGYCPPPSYAQVPSPGQVMSPGSHYAPSHVSDQPMTSPAAGALAPPQVMQNQHQNSAQMSRNCGSNGAVEHGPYYQAPSYGCQSQMANNCGGAMPQQIQPARPAINQPCGSMHGPACRPPSVACQPMSPHCQPPVPAIEAGASPHPRPMSTGPPMQQQTQPQPQHTQCSMRMSTSSDQCSMAPKPNVIAPAMSPAIADQCPRSVASFCSQPSPASQNPSDMQVQSPCSQMSGGACAHPPMSHRPMNMMPKEAARGCAPGTCHAQYCCQNSPQQQNLALPAPQQQPHQQQLQRYNGCGNECQWAGYNNSEHCCGNRHNAPEIQCRDISQSQQGSPMKPPQGMHQDSYRRTLEYVQQCRNWSGTNMSSCHGPESSVTSSTHPMPLPQPLPSSVNMIVNDMTSSLSSLNEENRFLQMIQ